LDDTKKRLELFLKMHAIKKVFQEENQLLSFDHIIRRLPLTEKNLLAHFGLVGRRQERDASLGDQATRHGRGERHATLRARRDAAASCGARPKLRQARLLLESLGRSDTSDVVAFLVSAYDVPCAALLDTTGRRLEAHGAEKVGGGGVVEVVAHRLGVKGGGCDSRHSAVMEDKRRARGEWDKTKYVDKKNQKRHVSTATSFDTTLPANLPFTASQQPLERRRRATARRQQQHQQHQTFFRLYYPSLDTSQHEVPRRLFPSGPNLHPSCLQAPPRASSSPRMPQHQPRCIGVRR
jgi:hypothetical protein